MQKTNFKTRLLALLTAAFMLVMCVPFAAFAEESKAKSITVSWADFKTKTKLLRRHLLLTAVSGIPMLRVPLF